MQCHYHSLWLPDTDRTLGEEPIYVGEGDNQRIGDVREDDADCAQDAPVHHPTVHGSARLRAALRKEHGLCKHRQQQHKLGKECSTRQEEREEEGSRAAMRMMVVDVGTQHEPAARCKAPRSFSILEEEY